MDMEIQKLLDLLRGHSVYIQTHNFPDPDAIGSAFGLQQFLDYYGIKSTLCYVGNIERLSLQSMISLLPIHFASEEELQRMTSKDSIVTVDGQKQNAEDQGGGEGTVAVAVGVMVPPGAETAADEAAGAHAHAEAEGLDDGHQGKDDADGGRGAGADLGDEVGVGGVVEDGDELAGHRGQGEGKDEPRHRRLRHAPVLGFAAVVHGRLHRCAEGRPKGRPSEVDRIQRDASTARMVFTFARS